jgi:molybdopterin converting factor small subunit
MKIRIKVMGPFIYEAGFSEKEFEVPPATTAEAALGLVSIPKTWPKIVTRNGKAVAPDERLADGDKIAISPIYSGG